MANAAIGERLRKLLQSSCSSLVVHGPSGCGKSKLVSECLGDLLPASSVAWFDPLDAGVVGGVEQDKTLRRSMDALRKSCSESLSSESKGGLSRGVYVVDDADQWFGSECPGKLVLAIAEALRNSGNGSCIVVLVVEDAEALHPLLRNCVEEWVGVELPTTEELEKAWAYWVHQLGICVHPEDVKMFNESCHGWVLSDVAEVCHALALDSKDPRNDILDLIAKHEALLFRAGSEGSCPWTVVTADRISTTWDSIGGLEDTKQALKEMVVWPVIHKHEMKRLGIRSPRGVLLYGPPGTGKTLLASAVAKEAKANFLNVSISDIVRGYIGEAEKALERVFAMARRVAPCVVFFDEFQAMFGNRETSGEVGRRLISQFLLESDNLPSGVVLLASTNVPGAIDPALLRPGRFDRCIQVPLPDSSGREVILSAKRAQMDCWKGDVDIRNLAELTNGWSGAELESLCQRAALLALERGETKVGTEEFHSIFAQRN